MMEELSIRGMEVFSKTAPSGHAQWHSQFNQDPEREEKKN